MRVRGLARLGLLVGAFVGTGLTSVDASSSATAVASASSSLNRFFSSDGPDTSFEAKNQGTVDEPKAWPEATAWLHAQLSDAERDFLLLTPTGTIDPTANPLGSFTAQQVADTSATVDASIRVNLQQLPPNFLATFRTEIINALSAVSTSASVGTPIPAPTVVGSSLMTTITWTFSNSVSATAVAQWRAFASAFQNAASVLRQSSTFQDLDLSFFVTQSFKTGAPSTTASPTGTTAAPNACAATATPCLNGGTCINGSNANSYTCSCASGFIGSKCEFSLFGARRSAHTASGAIPRGKSVTRPNGNMKTIKPHSA